MAKQALPGAKRLNGFAMDPEALTIVGLDTKDGPEHPLYDERVKKPLLEGLVLNIMKYGVLEHVLVRKNGDQIEVLAGRRRVRHAREANKRLLAEGAVPVLVPCTVKRPKDAEALGILISENENREGDSPVVRAHKAQRLVDYGQSETEIAVTFGLTTQGVKNLLQVLELSPKVQKAIEAGSISYTAATELRDLTHNDQDVKLDELIASGATTVAEAKRQRTARKKGNGGDAGARGARPGVSTLRKVAENEEFVNELSPDAKALLAWMLGDEGAARRVKGLTALLKG
jgi:ParB family chromosome partitioning protein